MKAVNRWNLDVAKFAAEEQRRYALHGLHLENGRTVATDGRVAVGVDLLEVSADGFPEIVGAFKPDVKKVRPCLVSPATCKEVKKGLPAGRVCRLKPACANAILDTHGVKKNGDGTVKFGTADLKSSTVIPASPLEGRFPDVKRVIPKGDPERVIYMDGKLLGKVLDFLGRFHEDGTDTENYCVKISLYDTEVTEAIKIETENAITGQKAFGVVMPMETPKEGGK